MSKQEASLMFAGDSCEEAVRILGNQAGTR